MGRIKVYFDAKGPQARDLYQTIDKTYIIFDSDDRVTAEVEQDWEGFKDGTIQKILKHFYEAVYIGISFITEDSDYRVSDFSGKPIEPYTGVIEQRKIFRYVKKKLSIAKIIDHRRNTFEIKRYLLNIRFTEPVVKVLDLYSVGEDSGVRYDEKENIVVWKEAI